MRSFQKLPHSLTTLLLASLSVVLAPIGTPSARAATVYTKVDIGTLGGTNSYSVAINDAGQIAGYSNPTGSSNQHAFRWDATNGMTDLGTLGGVSSIPVAMNDGGTVVGRSPIPTGQSHAFVWDEVSGIVDIGSLGGANTTNATAINSAGTVVGSSTYSGAATHAFKWDSTNGIVDLGTLGGTRSAAAGINDAGQIVGSASIAGDAESHAFVWDATSGMVDLGTLGGGTVSSGSVINDLGQVGGISGGHAFFWDATSGMVDLGTTSAYVYGVTGISNSGDVSGFGFDAFEQARGFVANPIDGFTAIDASAPIVVAAAINSAGQVAGVSWGSDVDHAFIYDRAGGARILDSGTFGAGAVDINNAGQVTGSAFVGNFVTSHAVMWVSATGPTVSVATASVVEGDGGTSRLVNFAVTLSAPATNPISVPYFVTPSANQNAATNGTDFKTIGGTLTFKPAIATGLSVTTKFISVKVFVDSATEGNENFVVSLGTPTGGYSLGNSVVTAHILDNDPAAATPEVSTGDASIWEGDTGIKNPAKLWVSLNRPAATTMAVTVIISGGTAIASTDFKPFTKTLTFAPGQYQKAIAVTVFPDTAIEGNETVTVTLSNPTGPLALARSAGTINILDED